RSVQIVVDGSRHADHRDIEFVLKNMGPGKRAVSSDGHQRVNSRTLQLVVGLPAPLGCGKFIAPGCLQHGTAPLDNIRYRFYVERLNFTVDHSFIAPHDSRHLKVMIKGSPYHGPDTGVHSGSIPS